MATQSRIDELQKLNTEDKEKGVSISIIKVHHQKLSKKEWEMFRGKSYQQNLFCKTNLYNDGYGNQLAAGISAFG